MAPTETETGLKNTKPKKLGLRNLARRFTLGLAMAGWFLGTLFQLAIQDRFQPLAPLFYAAPWPLISFCGLFILALTRKAKRRRLRLGFMLLVATQIGWTAGLSAGFAQGSSAAAAIHESSEKPIRLMFWNVCRGLLGLENVAADINQYRADIIAMVEATDEGQDVDFWAKHCPDYDPVRLGSGMAVLVRGKVVRWSYGSVNWLCRYRILTIDIDGREFDLLIVDITSDPRRYRRPALDRLAEIARDSSDRPFLIVGDFNTPPESTHYAKMRRELAKGFEVCGEGYRETWPTFAPVLDLDQVWGNKKIDWHRCWRGWSMHSDHRPTFVEFDVK